MKQGDEAKNTQATGPESAEADAVAGVLAALPRRMLVAAWRQFGRKPTWKERPLWAFISDMTMHGSGYSIGICRALGWNPHQDCASADLRYEPDTSASASTQRLHGPASSITDLKGKL